MSTQTETSSRSGGFRFPIGGMISGAIAGFGVLILLQQFAVVYPTRVAVIGCLVVGAVIALLLVNLAAATSRKGEKPAPVASAAPVAAEPVAAAAAPVVEDRVADAWADESLAGDFAPTHDIVAGGTSAYEQPDPSLEPTPLDGGLDVMILGTDGGWTEIRCSNGWTAWVDSTALRERAPGG